MRQQRDQLARWHMYLILLARLIILEPVGSSRPTVTTRTSIEKDNELERADITCSYHM